MRSAAQPASRRRSQAATKPSRPCSARRLLDRGLVGLRGSGGEGERDVAETEFEQAIAAPRLAVVVALRRRAREDLDLAVVQAEAPVDRRDLRLDRALVRQEQPRRAALDDGGRDRASRRCPTSDWVAKMTEAFFLRSVFSHSRSWPAKPSSSRASQPSSMISSVGRPSSRPSMRWNR